MLSGDPGATISHVLSNTYRNSRRLKVEAAAQHAKPKRAADEAYIAHRLARAKREA